MEQSQARRSSDLRGHHGWAGRCACYVAVHALGYCKDCSAASNSVLVSAAGTAGKSRQGRRIASPPRWQPGGRAADQLPSFLNGAGRPKNQTEICQAKRQTTKSLLCCFLYCVHFSLPFLLKVLPQLVYVAAPPGQQLWKFLCSCSSRRQLTQIPSRTRECGTST